MLLLVAQGYGQRFSCSAFATLPSVRPGLLQLLDRWSRFVQRAALFAVQTYCRFKDGLGELQAKGWDEDVAMSAMRRAEGNSTAALLALEEEDR